MIWRKDLLDLNSMQEVHTNSGIKLKEDARTLGKSNSPVTRLLKPREEVSVWAWMQQRDWDIRWAISLDQLPFNIPPNLEVI